MTGTSSRWANVNRSAIASGTHSTSSRYNHNSNYSNGGSNYHNHRNYHNDHRRKHGHHHNRVKAIFFGDSFIKLFGLVNEYTDAVLKTPPTIEVQKYKAASAKGLCREGNENRRKICQTMEKIRLGSSHQSTNNNHNDTKSTPTSAYPNLERLVFCFGSVDVHMSFYYKKYVQHQPLDENDLRGIATNYVDFVAGLETGITNNTTPLTKLIVGIYPSPLCDEDVGNSLLAYGSLETKDQVAAVDASDDRFIESRQARVDLFNRALQDRCDFHNHQNGSNKNKGVLEYWDVRDDLLTHDEATQRVKIKDAYKDVSDLNIHLIHETTLQLWVQKWPWYEALTTWNNGTASQTTNNRNILHNKMSFLEYLQKTFEEYRKTKPWAERTHVAETRGIALH